MGPKKKAEPGAQDNAQKVEFLTNKVQALQYQIVWEQQRTDRSRTQQKNMRKQIVKIDEEFKKQKQQLFQASTKLTEQYQATEKQLKQKVEDKPRYQQLQSHIEKSKETLKNTRSQYQQKLKAKEKQLNELKQKMQDMSIEFSRMLRETLEKMQQRIQLQQWDNESDPQLVKKMKDLSDLYGG